jgi:hypothetical protein
MATIPATPSFQSINVSRSRVTPMTKSPFTGDIQVYEWVGSDKWQFDATLPPISDNATKALWIQFLIDLEGMSDPFTFDLNAASGSLYDYAQGQVATYPTSWIAREPSQSWSIDENGLLVDITIRAIEA